MKRNSLTTAVVAGIAGTVGIANLASAVNLNPDGLGQVLIYPYYTVNDNGSGKELQTLFSVVNTTNQGKAVKVRFVEGYNSREVRDFHVYLSPYDVWTATLFKLPAEEQANLVTYDTSCTVPQIRGASGRPELGTLPNGATFLRFTNARYSGTQYGDGGPAGLERTREGHFEIIEMGVVTNATRDSLDAITHVAGVPDNCAQVVGAWVQQPAGYWTTNPSIDIDPPTGGLFGSALIVDVATGVSAGYSADAIDGFIAADSADNLHAPPGNTEPSLAQVGGLSATSVTSYVFDNGNLIQATYGAAAPGSRKIDAVSALFTQDNIFNEYVLDGGAAATTDWVVTFPTKRFYVDEAIVGPNAAPTVTAPFAQTFRARNGAGSGSSEIEVGLFPFDREEASPGQCTGSDENNPNCGVCFSPCDESTFDPPVLKFEAQVISFKRAADFEANPISTVLGSKLASNVDVRADSLSQGWMRIALNPLSQPHALKASSEGEVFSGLPATGFAITNYVNANAAPGRLANYSGLWHHKGSRSCAAGAAACS